MRVKGTTEGRQDKALVVIFSKSYNDYKQWLKAPKAVSLHRHNFIIQDSPKEV